MKKQVLMLSVAVAVSFGAPAFADPYPIDDITDILTAPITTATANTDGTPADIKIDAGGGITVAVGGPAVTINSNNSFDQITGTTISNKATDSAVGILVDLTKQNLDTTNDVNACPAGDCHVVEGIVENGTIDLSGSGTNKRGLWLQGQAVADGVTPFTFTGNIDMSNSTMTVTGDNSVGVLIDQETILNGSLTMGNITISPTSQTTSTVGVIGLETNGTINGDINVGLVTGDTTTATAVVKALGSTGSTAAGTIGLELGGTINGNVTIAKGSQVFAAGTGSQGILLTGDINPCDAAVAPDCTSLGSLVNNGVIETVGTSNPGTNLTGNPTSGTALGIGGSIAGGILNAGPTASDSTILAGLIEAQSFAPVVEIAPTLGDPANPVSIEIGKYTGDTDDPGFGFYNRGSILAVSSNINQSTQAFLIAGSSDTVTASIDGGLFNSGTISATVTTNSSASAAQTANAIFVGADAIVGGTENYLYNSDCDCMVYQGGKGIGPGGQDDRAALVNSNEVVGSGGTEGTIVASISGAFSGNTATAISIAPGGTLPSIINSGLIQAVATTSDTTISDLHATAIVDASGTLTYIQNNGSIQALATTLKDGSQTAVAIDLSADKGVDGVEILNQATADQSASIFGDIKFGSGDHQILKVLGASTDEQATIIGDITFGGGSTAGTDELTIGNFATVTGTVLANPDMGVNVDIQNNGTLILQNDETALNASTFHVEAGGELDLTVLEEFKTGIIESTGPVTFDQGAKLNITYGSFIPEDSTFVLATAPTGDIQVPDIQIYRDQLAQSLPFLFQSADLQIQPGFNPGTDEFALIVDPKTAAQLGLTGYAVQMLPLANQALVNDDPLGAAMVAGIVDQKSAQQAYDQYAPDVTGGARAIAMSLTDQATGPVASRQRILRMYGKASGEITLWGQEFAEFIKDPGDVDTGQTGFKDHGFGFVLGMDGGDPKSGWYGGAFTFYSGDIVEALPRDSHTNTLWYMLSGYTDWRGRGLFLDTKLDVGYVNLKSKRFLNLTIPSQTGGDSTKFIDEADGNRPGLVGSAGFTTGVILAYGATTISPQVSVDAMTLREEGYSESHPTTAPGNGNGFNLTTSSYYANSLRAFIGADVRQDLDMGDFFLQPDVRLGYRYDFLNDPTKLKAQFSNVPVNGIDQPGPQFTIEGPDPSQGNLVAGASLSATTDAWTLGANFDYVRGTNGATTEVGMIHLLGRI